MATTNIREKMKTKIKKAIKKEKTKKSIWNGPEIDGITQSLLKMFLVCRERFRLRVVDGLAEADRFSHRLEYGNMWHLCEEFQSNGEDWQQPLLDYCAKLCNQYRAQQEEINKWYNVCKTQFPIYLRYWKKQKQSKSISLMQEETFCVPYELPSGRIVKLLGKWDGVEKINRGIWLKEHKTKSEIDEQRITRQLSFDLQTMMYLVALQMHLDKPIKGVVYNVVRRPLSGGKGTIRQHKPTKAKPNGETAEEFYNRLGGIIEDAAETYFARWKVSVTQDDIERFEKECLVPILEQLYDWWEWIDSDLGKKEPFANSIHFRFPYGGYNSMVEGKIGELDEYLATGNDVGLERNKPLFEEL